MSKAPKRSLFDRLVGRAVSTPAKKVAKKTPKPVVKKSAKKTTKPVMKKRATPVVKKAAKKAAKKTAKTGIKKIATKAATKAAKKAAKKAVAPVLTKAQAAKAKAAAATAKAKAKAKAARDRAKAQAAAAKAKAKAKAQAEQARRKAARERVRAVAAAKAATATAKAKAERERIKAARERVRAVAAAKAARLKERAAKAKAAATAKLEQAKARAAAAAARAQAAAEAKAAREAAKAKAKADREAAKTQAKADREAAKAQAKMDREVARLAASLARRSAAGTSRGGRITRGSGASEVADRALSLLHTARSRRSPMPAHIADLTVERLQELQPTIDPDLAVLLVELLEDGVPTVAEIAAGHERWVADRPEGEVAPLSVLIDIMAAIGLEPSVESDENDELSAIVGAFALQSAVAPVPLSEIQSAFEKMAASIEASGGAVPTIERFLGAIAAAGVRIDDEEDDGEVIPEAAGAVVIAGDYTGASWDAYSQWRREVANHKILSREEETEITHRYAFYRSSVESLTASLARLDEQIAAGGTTTPQTDPAEAARLAEIAALMAEDPEAAAALRTSGVDVAAVVAAPVVAADPHTAALLAERATIVDDLEAAKAAMSRTEDYFLRCNYKLVLKHARAFYEAGRRRIDLMDLVQQGNTGMVEAFRRFDPTRGFKFSTFATFHIKQKISEWARERGSSIRIPTFRQREWVRLNAYKAEFYNAHGRQPTDEELAEKFGKTEKKIKEIFAAEALSSPSSIDKPVSEEEGSATMGDLIEDSSAINPEDHLIRTHVANEIADALMRCLTPRERRVIQSRFGLYTGAKETLEEIGRRMRITRERVRQIEARALEKLREDETIRGMQGSKAGFAGVPWAASDELDR
jgi:RNA polymerase primary sigma factor